MDETVGISPGIMENPIRNIDQGWKIPSSRTGRTGVFYPMMVPRNCWDVNILSVVYHLGIYHCGEIFKERPFYCL